MDNLTPNQQDVFKKLLRRPKLSKNDDKTLGDLKNSVVHGEPLDGDHPGMSHLTPRQQNTLKDILAKKNDGKPIVPKDRQTLQNLQNLMLNGKPLDSKHPGYKKLKPKEQDAFDKLAN